MPKCPGGRAGVALALFLLLLSPSWAQERPVSGSGVLILCQSPSAQQDSRAELILYRQPGVGRLATAAPASMPSLAPALNLPEACTALAVTGKWNSWFKVIRDDAGREGWLHGRRPWQYAAWQDYLVGRRVVPAGRSALRSAPHDQAPPEQPIKPGEMQVIHTIQDDWAASVDSTGHTGWFRWRDRNGRLVISVSAASK